VGQQVEQEHAYSKFLVMNVAGEVSSQLQSAAMNKQTHSVFIAMVLSDRATI
jgi:hypothetical protein